MPSAAFGSESSLATPTLRPSFDVTTYASLLEQIAADQPVDPRTTKLVDAAIAVWTRPGFDTFVSLPHLRFEPFDYQMNAAGAVLRRMHGRAILADEVGLGKTIEAGLVMSELRMRGLAGKILVLAPAGLVEQWREELDRKFALPSEFVSAKATRTDGWDNGSSGDRPILLASLATARRPPLRDSLAGIDWDLVIVDEDHRLQNPSTASSKLVRSLRTRHLLLLTATPVENRLSDLFNLTSLVAPGLLGTARDFRSRHGSHAVGEAARDIAGLRTRVSEVMVRHRRSDVALMLPRRLAETKLVKPVDAEAELYRHVANRVREEGHAATPAKAMALRSALRLAGSSPAALQATLDKLGWSDLHPMCNAVERWEKAAVLLEVIRRRFKSGEKVAVFTAFRNTQQALLDLLAASGVKAAVYHGGLSRRQKEEAITAFRDSMDVLVTTEAAGEGRNLQFCHVIVNFDLPWNPMQIEQRLGRIHRIGQSHDVVVVNLVGRGTIEEHIFSVLQAKINLFELVVGELDMILGRVDDDFDFEHSVFEAHVSSADDVEFAARLEKLGNEIADARRNYSLSRERNDALIGDPQDRSNGS